MKKMLLIIGFSGYICAYAEAYPPILVSQPKVIKVSQNFLQDVSKNNIKHNENVGKIKSAEVSSKSGYVVNTEKPLELGNLNVYSVIGQPLDAEIEILNGEYYNTTIAGSEEYESRGLLKENFIKNININVVKKNSKRYIKLSSKESLPTGFLDLVLVLQKDKQKEIKELILSAKEQVLPSVIPVDAYAKTELYKEQPKPMVATKSLPTTSKVKYEYVEIQNKTAVSKVVSLPVKTNTEVTSSETEYKISRGETVYTIAEKLNPNILKRRFGAVLFLENPDCFLRGDMNKIIAGKTLKVPTLEVINKYSDAEINNKVAHANKNWLGEVPMKQTKQVKEEKPVVLDKPAVKSSEVEQPKEVEVKTKEKTQADLQKIKELEEHVATSTKKLKETNENVKKLEKQVKDLSAELQDKEDYILKK